jgi:drug/metabolite transporter (DMT)-like permease
MDDALRTERRRRHRLYAIGTAVAIAGITLGTMPYFAERTPILVAKGCALAGAVILAVGRFASDHFLRRFLR